MKEMAWGRGHILVVAVVVLYLGVLLSAQDPAEEDFCQTLWANVCENGGICYMSTKDDFECQCIGQWTGKNCSVLAVENACSSEPCLHGGVCILLKDGSFTCDCTREFLGPFCEERDPCIGSTACKMGSTCVRRTDSEFECQCRTPYGGLHCDEEDLCLIDMGECVDDLIPTGKCYPCGSNETCSKIDEDTYCCDPECDPSTTIEPPTVFLQNKTRPEPRVTANGDRVLTDDSGYPTWNMFIPTVVICTLLAYLLVLAIVVRLDHWNKIFPRLIIMGDVRRITVDTFYLLTVETGNTPCSGTSARIYCVLFGELAQTKVLVLNNYLMKSMRENDEIDFLISTPRPLGNIFKIQLWLDPEDKSDRSSHPNWYCRHVVVRNIKNNAIWYFFVEKWLSFELSESSATETWVAGIQEVFAFYTTRLSWREYWHQTREHHIWLQTLTCSPRSTHTMAERWTCCTALFLCYMFFTLLFYGIPEDYYHFTTKSFHREVVFSTYYPIWSIGTKASLAGILVGYILTIGFRFIRRQLIPALIVWDDDGVRKKNVRVQTESVQLSGGALTPFRIPSTDMLETEEWINEINVDSSVISTISEMEPYQDRYVHKYKGRPRHDKTWIHKSRLRGRKRQKESLSAQQLSALTEVLADTIPEPIVIMQKKRRKYLTHIRTKLLNRYSNKRISFTGDNNGTWTSNSLGTKPKILTGSTEKIGDNITPVNSQGEILDAGISLPITGEGTADSTKPWKLELCCVEHSLERHHCLPRWFIWVAWAIPLSLIITFSILLIYYGFRFNREKSLNWLGSFGWAFIESIFILQPLKVFLAYLILLFKRRIGHDKNPEQFDVKLRFKLMWIGGEIEPLVIWPLYYLIHPLRFNDEHELDPSRCVFPLEPPLVFEIPPHLLPPPTTFDMDPPIPTTTFDMDPPIPTTTFDMDPPIPTTTFDMDPPIPTTTFDMDPPIEETVTEVSDSHPLPPPTDPEISKNSIQLLESISDIGKPESASETKGRFWKQVRQRVRISVPSLKSYHPSTKSP